jgi:Conserved TM helix
MRMNGVDLNAALREIWRSTLEFVPTAAAFLAILLVGYVVARVIRAIVTKALRRVGFDRAVEHGGIGRVLRRGDYDATEICARLAYYAVLLFTLQLAFGIWGPNPISDVINALVAWLPRAFVAIVIVVVAAAIANAVRDLIGAALGGLSYGRLIGTIAFAFILGLGIIAALDQVGIATTVTTPVLVAVLATVAGILIVGVGGGLVRPMQRRWEGWLDRAAAESQVIKERAQALVSAREVAREVEGETEAALDPGIEETQVIHAGTPRTPGFLDSDVTQALEAATAADRSPEAALSAEETQVIDTEHYRKRV